MNLLIERTGKDYRDNCPLDWQLRRKHVWPQGRARAPLCWRVVDTTLNDAVLHSGGFGAACYRRCCPLLRWQTATASAQVARTGRHLLLETVGESTRLLHCLGAVIISRSRLDIGKHRTLDIDNVSVTSYLESKSPSRSSSPGSMSWAPTPAGILSSVGALNDCWLHSVDDAPARFVSPKMPSAVAATASPP